MLALAFITAATSARADLVTYKLSGTISSTAGASSSYAVGDPITWLLQYDRSAPPTATPGSYSLSGPVITDIVDKKTGYHFFTPASATTAVTLSMKAGQAQATDVSQNYSTSLTGTSRGPLPTADLALFSPGSVPWVAGQLQYSYTGGTNPVVFTASAGSLSAGSVQTPEPGALALLVLGVSCLAAGPTWRRLGQIV